MSQYRIANRVLAGAAFVIALATYTLTLQPSVPFWDCGEFSAAAAWQQVPHPPGAPLWLIVARIFHMLPFGDPGWRINMVSAVSSAFTAMFVYLIVVQIIERWNPFRQGKSIANYLPTLGGALIAALAFTWSDTNWFNSVESEVYAAGNLLIALLIWLMMQWDRKSETPGHERYLLLSAYVIGLSIGVHLLALLVIPAIAMVIYFKRYQFKLPTFLLLMAITATAFYLIYKAPLSFIPNLLANNAAIGVIVLAALIGLIWWAGREHKSVVYTAALAFVLILLGYTSYTQILVRSSSHPPMNENEPDTFTELASYLGREQYGDRPPWPRRVESKASNSDYGEWYPPTGRDEDGNLIFERINTSGELNFLLKYQVGHMYVRYFAWNFIGRVSDVQNAGVGFPNVNERDRALFIQQTGYDDVFPIQFFALPFLLGLLGLFYHYKRDWKMAFAFTALFLLLGVLATLQQNQQQPQPRERDYFYVGSFMVFAMWIGIGASGLAESIGARKRREGKEEQELPENAGNPAIAAGILGLCLLTVPINMVVDGWKFHDRSGNWVPWDYAYNILQSCEQDAILFTNGDNDTFPIWYLQDVAGVRRDVRLVNLSLGNTLWYIWQLKNERPWGTEKVPLSFTDESLRAPENSALALRPERGAPPVVELGIPADVMAWATNGATTTSGLFRWQMQGAGSGEDQIIRVQEKLIQNILENNNWKRPVYFSTSVGQDAWAGLEPYFLREGMAYRVMPVQQQQSSQAFDFPVNIRVSQQCLINVLPDDEYHTEPHYGFKLRNMNNPKTFFLDDHRRLGYSYRIAYLGYAQHLLRVERDSSGAIAALNAMEANIAPDMFAMPYWMSYTISNLYKEAGNTEQSKRYAQRTLDWLKSNREALKYDPQQNKSFNPDQIEAQMLVNTGNYGEAITLYQNLMKTYGSDPRLLGLIDELRVEKHLAKKDTAGAVAEIRTLLKNYEGVTDTEMSANRGALQALLVELTGVPEGAAGQLAE